jgi:O-antigen/teichoic acid export membrane protein
VRTAYVENLQRTLLLALPVTAGLAIATEPIVDALLGDGWEGVVEPLRILAAYGLVRLITAPSGEVFKGMGKPHLSLFASVVFLVVGLVSLIVLVPRHGTSGAAFAMLIAVSLSGVVAMAITLNVLELTVAGLARDLARPFACALVVALTLAALVPATSGLAPWPALAILTCAGTVAFVASVAVIGRPLVAPVRAALRRT